MSSGCKVLGLDISTSIIGYSIYYSDGRLEKRSHIDLRKPKKMTFWEKVDYVEKFIDDNWLDFSSIGIIFIEEVKKNFKQGASSADVIVKMVRFNGVVSHIIRKHTGVEPIYISEGHARKVCGLKMRPKAKAEGKSHKEQAFDQMCERDLFKDVEWDRKRTGKIRDYHYDEMDAIIVALCGIEEFLNE